MFLEKDNIIIWNHFSFVYRISLITPPLDVVEFSTQEKLFHFGWKALEYCPDNPNFNLEQCQEFVLDHCQ